MRTETIGSPDARGLIGTLTQRRPADRSWGTAKLNDVDSQAWLADVPTRIAEHPVNRLDELLRFNWAGPVTALAPLGTW